MKKKASPTVTMRVRVGDSELEVTGPSGFVEQKISEFVERLKGLPAPADATRGREVPASGARAGAGLKKISVSQLFNKLSLSTDNDRVLAAGYFLEKFEKFESFTSAEIRDTIRKAKHAPPANPSDAISKNIRKGLMMAAGEKDGKRAYVLTSDGENAINDRRTT